MSVPDAVKTPAAVRAIVAKALAGKVLSRREQDRLRDELERREGAVPGKPPASSPFTPPPPPVNTPVGLARRYPAMTCGDTNESADADASPPFAMTPTLLAEAARLAMRNVGTGKGPSNPLGRALAAGSAASPSPPRRGTSWTPWRSSGRGRLYRMTACGSWSGRRRTTTTSPS